MSPKKPISCADSNLETHVRERFGTFGTSDFTQPFKFVIVLISCDLGDFEPRFRRPIPTPLRGPGCPDWTRSTHRKTLHNIIVQDLLEFSSGKPPEELKVDCIGHCTYGPFLTDLCSTSIIVARSNFIKALPTDSTNTHRTPFGLPVQRPSVYTIGVGVHSIVSFLCNNWKLQRMPSTFLY